MKKKCTLLLLIAGISGIVNHSVLAGDAKSIPGTNCHDISNQDDVSYVYGSLRNDLNIGNNVICPIVRDNMNAQSTHFTNSVKVRLYKRNSAITTCSLVSRSIRNPDGRNNLGSIKTGFVEGVGYRTIYIPKTIRSYTSGPMFIHCQLNAGDHIFGINYDEK